MSNKLSNSKSYLVADIIKWFNDGELELSPKYQRSQVWNEMAKSYFIDSLIKGMPIPPIFIRQTTDISASKVFKEVLDGQQRLHSILEFYNDKSYWLTNHSDYNQRKKYSELKDEEKESFFNYEIPVQIVTTRNESLIYEMFTRLNSYNYILNKQEMRNAKFWGHLKLTVSYLSNDCRSFFIEKRTFKDSQISRLKDQELIVHLLLLIKNNITDGKDSTIEKFYQELDGNAEECNRLSNVFYEIFNIYKTLIGEHEFSFFTRPNYIYTIFALIISDKSIINKIDIVNYELRRIDYNLCDTKDYIYSEFANLHNRRTTDKEARINRFEILKGLLNDLQ